MIYVQPLPVPAFFDDFVHEYTSREGFSVSKIGQKAIVFPRAIEQSLYAVLQAKFAGKCAYCERAFSFENKGLIEQFRPKRMYGAAASLDWNNLLLACTVCNRNKRARFPLLEGEPDSTLSYPERVRCEQPMLLHPCIDEPDRHLRFSSDGMVQALTERGSVTIALLDLNRMQLVEARQSAIAAMLMLPEAKLDDAVDRATPYSASLRHTLLSYRDTSFREEVASARHRQARFDQVSERVATDKGQGLPDYQRYERYIERVELRNIGSIAALELNLLADGEEGTPRFALLGENGIGKSTILRAIACALAGPVYARKLRLTSNSLLAAGARSGEIMVRVTGYRDPVRVNLRRGRPLQYSSEDGKILVLAYGASRLLAVGRHKAEMGERHAKVRNLFDPFVPVGDASAWLEAVPPELRDDVCSTLEQILGGSPVAPGKVVHVEQGRLRFAIGEASPRPVAALSDGYKALIGIAGDIMAVMHAARFETMAEAMGIVLIDELGNHFHPQLKLRIVGSLRAAFPKIQFIYTTHEPLCLRGMTSNEIAVLRRDEQGVYLLTGLPDVASMRIDQLLASEHFGLGSTVDPARATEIRRYHALMRMPERSDDEDEELGRLQNVLGQTDYLGGTRRERMLLSLLDMHGEEPARAPGASVNAKAMSERTVNRLKQILQAVGPAGKEGA